MTRYCVMLALLLLVGACAGREEKEKDPKATLRQAAADSASVQATAGAPDFTTAGLEEPDVRVFLDKLQQAVARGDRRQVAALVAYPITVEIQGQPRMLRDAADFVAHYPDVMSEQVKAAVRDAAIDNLFVNWQGVRLGHGEVWFGGITEGEEVGKHTFSIKIVAFNAGTS